MLSFVLLKSSPPLLTILQHLDEDDIAVRDVIVRRPTLDEAFLHLTRGGSEMPELPGESLPELEPVLETCDV